MDPRLPFCMGCNLRIVGYELPWKLVVSARLDHFAGFAALIDRKRIPSAGIVCNIPEFYDAFGVKEGDRLYRSNDARVDIW
jgi:hypothetical protein